MVTDVGGEGRVATAGASGVGGEGRGRAIVWMRGAWRAPRRSQYRTDFEFRQPAPIAFSIPSFTTAPSQPPETPHPAPAKIRPQPSHVAPPAVMGTPSQSLGTWRVGGGQIRAMIRDGAGDSLGSTTIDIICIYVRVFDWNHTFCSLEKTLPKQGPHTLKNNDRGLENKTRGPQGMEGRAARAR